MGDLVQGILFAATVFAVLFAIRWLVLKWTENNRKKKILAHSEEWGEKMCQWLIDKRVNPSDKRVERILIRLEEWGEGTCQNLIQQSISLGMTDEMVTASLGKPTTIDQREVSERGEKFRWVYGIPRQGAAYIWFSDGKVTKIKQ